MEKNTLSDLFQGRCFRIPDYQRGYAWEQKQWKDFVLDIDALIDENINSHYTGTIVVYQNPNEKNKETYSSTQKLITVDIVDGQQRLTTCSLYLSIILHKLAEYNAVSQDDYKSAIKDYLYNGCKCRLLLNNDTSDCYFDLISKGSSDTSAITVHQKRIFEAYTYLKKHIEVRCEEYNENANIYLSSLLEAITDKMNFTFYPIESESEIGMTFELMNSRGKDLSILELLKNYLMHWVYRNCQDKDENITLTILINKCWKKIYTNIADCNGNEDQCLRVAWTLYCNPIPKNWQGYKGFKENEYIPLRDFSFINSKKTVQEFITTFVNGLAEISFAYSRVICPKLSDCSENEIKWISKIINAGNIANFLPLLVSSKIRLKNKTITEDEFLNLLKSLENYSYRVFIWEGKRSNAGISLLYKWGYEIFHSTSDISIISDQVLTLASYYSNEIDFRNYLNTPNDWYSQYRLIRYTLFEYELYLLEKEGKNHKPKLLWSDLSYSTIEHILPQTIDKGSYWKKNWKVQNVKLYLHDIGNLVLTENNSNYLNFDFSRKKGKAGEGFCYANSDIRQERKIARFKDWTIETCEQRRKEISKWVINRWGNHIAFTEAINIPIEEDDEE